MTTYDDLVRERNEFRTEATNLLTRAGDGDLIGDDAARFDQLTADIEERNSKIRDIEDRDRRANDLVRQIRAGTGGLEGEGRSLPGYGRTIDGQDIDRTPAARQRDDAMRTLERASKAGKLEARGAETVERLIGSGQNWATRWAIAAGSEHYERAFAKMLTDPDRGHLTWTAQEADAYRDVAALQFEQRALGLGSQGGAYMVPLTLDPAILLSSAGSTSSIREIARVVQIATDSWNGVSSAGVTAEWLDEADEAADASPTLTQPSIPVFKGSAFVPYSFELEGDGLSFMTELSRLLMDAAMQLSDAAYTTGNGTTAPKGFITALAAVGGSLVSPTTAEAFAAEDVYKVQNALPPRFQPNARWAANLSILNSARQFETDNGALKFPSLQDNPATLLGRPVHEQSNMDGTYNPNATADNYVLAYGDWSQFVIADRIGAQVEIVAHLVGENRRPTGQRGALLWFRTGSDVATPNAFRLLSLPTSGS